MGLLLVLSRLALASRLPSGQKAIAKIQSAWSSIWVKQLARLDLEDPDGPVGARGGDLLAVGAESDREDDVLGLDEVADRLAPAARLGEPELGDAVDARVAAGGRQPLAVGAVGDVVDPLGQPGQPAVQRAVGRLPERDLVITRRRDRRSIPAELERRDRHGHGIGRGDRDRSAVRLNGQNICEVSALTIRQANRFFENLTLTTQQQEIAGGILVEIQQRLHFLDAVGLEYITLDRLASTLSGGEAQRIELATSLGSRLVGALYVLDEPSIGLHSRDTAKLIRILEELRDLGNTILWWNTIPT